jgi:hypothetical protein
MVYTYRNRSISAMAMLDALCEHLLDQTYPFDVDSASRASFGTDAGLLWREVLKHNIAERALTFELHKDACENFVQQWPSE